MPFFGYEDRELDSSVYGFDSYTTDKTPSESPQAKISVTPSDVLAKLHRLRNHLNSHSIGAFIEKVEAHIDDMNNPHHTDLEDFTEEVIDVLYKGYVEAGGKASKPQYVEYLFAKIRIATDEELETMSSTLLVSVAAARKFFARHERDLEAHKHIVQEAYPGDAVLIEPQYAVYSYVGVDQTKITGEVSQAITYVDVDGVLKVASDKELPIDYWNGIPCIPCFGDRTNEIANANDFTVAVGDNVTIELATDKKAPNTRDKCVVVTTGKDIVPFKHVVTLPKVKYAKSKTFSIFAAAGTCRYLTMEITHNEGMNLPTRAQFDLHTGRCICFNTLGHYSARIRRLADGWYRCEFTMHHSLGNYDDLRLIFHKDVVSVETATYQFTGDNEKCMYLFGMQLEIGHRASPYIPTLIGPVTRKGRGMTIPMPNLQHIHTIALQATRTVRFEPDDRPLPLFALRDKNDNTCLKAELLYDGTTKITHMINVETADGWQTNELHVDFLYPTTGNTTKVVSSTGEDTVQCHNGTYSAKSKAPKVKVDAVAVDLGHNGTDFMDEYLLDAFIYNTEMNEEQSKFLLGEVYQFDINQFAWGEEL